MFLQIHISFFPFSSRDGVVVYGGYGSVVEKSAFHTDTKHIFWEGDNILLNSNSDVSKDYFLISHSQNDQRKPNYNGEEGVRSGVSGRGCVCKGLSTVLL